MSSFPLQDHFTDCWISSSNIHITPKIFFLSSVIQSATITLTSMIRFHSALLESLLRHQDFPALTLASYLMALTPTIQTTQRIKSSQARKTRQPRRQILRHRPISRPASQLRRLHLLHRLHPQAPHQVAQHVTLARPMITLQMQRQIPSMTTQIK